MLDKFYADVGAERLNVPAERGLSFYQVLALASIVEREAVLDDERPMIAGVYQNRIDGLPGIKNKILNADPTVIYANDTVELAKLPFDMWQQYSFWSPPDVPMKDVVVPEELAGLPDLRAVRASSRARSRRRRCPRSMQRSSRTPKTSTCTSWRSPRAAARTPLPRANAALPEAPQEVRLHMSGRLARAGRLRRRRPTDRQRAAWFEADRAARPARLERAARRASRTQASTPTSASAPSTCAT